ncbi:PorT family protein [Spirosoma aureum]|uniref:PorT family protein n=1 Tax=Spirosoma aureum TaxID=2692134 RepID=A0A6G9ATY7_9BACT|nr:porin family protein [Spirosoma aureum]QIP15952.1 PorT family protein [Spirosoma aureum]
MKKFYFFTLFTTFWLVQQYAVAQKASTITHQTGLKAGLNLSRWAEGGNGQSYPVYSYRLFNSNVPGLQIGVWHQFTLSKKMAVATELYFATKGRSFNYILNDEDKSHQERTLGLTLPVLLCYQLVPKLSIKAGPAVNYMLTKTITFDLLRSLLYISSWDISAMAGLSYQLNNRWSTDLRYEYGFGNMLNHEPPGYKKIQNRSLQLSVQYQLGR